MFRVNHELEIKAALSRLGKMGRQGASPGSERRLLEIFRARQRRSRQTRLAWTVAAACSALLFGWIFTHDSAKPSRNTSLSTENYQRVMADFAVLPYAQSDVPLEQAVIVRVDLQPSELRTLGMPQKAAQSSGYIRADLLVGQDGIARAVRLVQ